MPISVRQSGKKTTPNYGSTDYSKSVDVGFKLLGILAALGVVLCLWLSTGREKTDKNALHISTMRLLVGAHEALSELDEPPGSETDAFKRLHEIVICSECKGSRKVAGPEGADIRCPMCNGVGVSRKVGSPGHKFKLALLEPAMCKFCRGSGVFNHANCAECDGLGYDLAKVDAILADLSSGVIRDSYGGKIQIKIDSSGKKTEYEIVSAGPDKYFKSGDEIKFSGVEKVKRE